MQYNVHVCICLLISHLKTCMHLPCVLALTVCLTLLASFFLLHLSNMYCTCSSVSSSSSSSSSGSSSSDGSSSESEGGGGRGGGKRGRKRNKADLDTLLLKVTNLAHRPGTYINCAAVLNSTDTLCSFHHPNNTTVCTSAQAAVSFVGHLFHWVG